MLLAVLVVVDLTLSYRRPRSLNIKVPPEIFIGETASLVLDIDHAPPGLWARFDWPTGLEGELQVPFQVLADGSATASVACRAVRRGTWQLDQVWLLWRSRFGLLEFGPRLMAEAEIKVVPNIRLVQSGEITTTVRSALYGVKENAAIGEGAEFHQLRDFAQGMDMKMIDWKRSARRRSLVAREMRAERNHHVIVAFDNGYLMREEIAGLPKIDHAVTAGLATAWAAAIGGDLVGYYSYDVRPRNFTAPIPGRTAFARLRNWTAGLDYVGKETNHTLALTELNARTPKRSLIIVFTDFVDTTSAELLIENLGVLAKRHVLIFVTIRDPELDALAGQVPEDLHGAARLVAANQSVSERRLVFERLARMGVTVIDAKPNTVGARLISAYLEIKAQELI
jgi:uncharacterized protein (DUF58 family)